MDMEELAKDIAELDGAHVGKEVNEFFEWVKSCVPVVLNTLVSIIIALVIFYLGRKLIKFVVKLMDKSLSRANVDDGVLKFLNSLVTIALTIILVVVLAGFVGIETSSFAAILASAGLAIGLSLQGSLSNFAGGVLILVMKPFVIGDYIIACGNEGVVTGIDIFYTKLQTGDNKSIVIPNGQLSNGTITNVTKQDSRRVDIVVGVEYSQNIQVVKELLLKLAASNELVDKEKAVDVFIDAFDASSVNIGFRVWTAKENYWTVKWALMESIKEEFDKKGISIPFNQLDVCIKKED